MYFNNVCRRLKSANITIFLSVVLWAGLVHAQLRVGVDYSTLQENRSATEISSVSRSILDFYFNVSLKKDFPLYLTLGYLNTDSAENYHDSTHTKLTSTNPYVGIAYHFWNKNSAGVIVGINYSPYAKLGVSDETGTETWNGNTAIFKMSGTFSLTAKFKLNAGISYISESFGERASGSVTNKSNFSQSYIMPSLGIAVAF